MCSLAKDIQRKKSGTPTNGSNLKEINTLRLLGRLQPKSTESFTCWCLDQGCESRGAQKCVIWNMLMIFSPKSILFPYEVLIINSWLNFTVTEAKILVKNKEVFHKYLLNYKLIWNVTLSDQFELKINDRTLLYNLDQIVESVIIFCLYI